MDNTGTAQVVLAAPDRRAHTFDSIAPRTDPVMDPSYKSYWGSAQGIPRITGCIHRSSSGCDSVGGSTRMAPRRSGWSRY